MIVAQISDTHIALDTPDADRRIGDFERTVSDINVLGPDVIIHTGDIVHNGRPDEYAKAVDILSAARAPVHVMVGNKDDRANLRAAFGPPESDFIAYAVEEYPVRMVLLDTLAVGTNKGDFCVERAQGAAELIHADLLKPVAVFAHHPPFEVPVGPEPFHFVSSEAMARLQKVIGESERVSGLFCGHVHRPAFGDVDGVPVTVATATATTLRWGQYPEPMRTRPIYSVHSFDADGSFSTETRIVGP